MYKLDRIEGTKALNEGFVMIFGEKHRKFIEAKGEELIELGLKNGVKWSTSFVLKSSKVSVYYDMYNDGIIKKEQIDQIEKDLPTYYTDEEIEIIKSSEEISGEKYRYMSGVEEYCNLFENTITQEDVNIVQATPFNYFKKFFRHEHYNLTLFDEGGLELDTYNTSNLKYYQEENELFYMIEAAARKYHYFGMLLTRNVILSNWIEKIKNNLTSDLHHAIQTSLSRIISNLIENESDSDKVIIDIQEHTGVKDCSFMTNKQISNRISLIK